MNEARHICTFCVCSFMLLVALPGLAQVKGEVMSPQFYTYMVGDDTAWAQPDFDDSHWPEKENGTFPPELYKDVGWLRMVMKVDTTLWNVPLGLSVWLAGAAELYVDGTLLYRFGKVGSSRMDEETRFGNQSPLVFSFHPSSKVVGSQSHHIFALRYSSFFLASPAWSGLEPGFGYNINALNEMIARYANNKRIMTVHQMILTSFFLVFAVVHLLLFLFYPSLRTNLYVAALSFSAGLLAFFNLGEDVVKWGSIQEWIWYLRFKDIAAALTFIFMLRFIHALVYPKLTRTFIALSVLAFGYVVWSWFMPFRTYTYGSILGLVTSLEVLRTILTARIKRRKMHLEGSWIMLFGAVPMALAVIYETLAWDLNMIEPFLRDYGFPTGFYGGGIAMVSISVFLGYNFARVNKNLTATNAALEDYSHTLEDKVTARTAELQQTLHHLTQTQDQLIHSEKMASLGQLTAGIAHEIKNPLNFVTNFAQLSAELADELHGEIKANKDRVLAEITDDIEELLADLKTNAVRINEHGQRADGIVRAMMQHASGGSGQRELTDVNELLEKYVNLAFHGKRAQQTSFNVEIERNYDERIGLVEMVPQEIGRVLLNLLSNAFDAVQEQELPNVKVNTQLHEKQLEIRVCDNGPGIPINIKDKIFEPFFTTKPMGAGTGLGLSLSYDIVTQGHGGTITVESEEGYGATFIVRIPT